MWRFTTLIVFVLCLCETACSGRETISTNLGPAPSPIPQPASGPLTGTYLGTSPTPLGSLNGIFMYQMVLDLREEPIGAVSGTWGVLDFPDGGGLTGTVENNRIVLRLTGPDTWYRIDGTVTVEDGDAFSGTLGYCTTLACSESGQPVDISFTRQAGEPQR